MNVSDLLPLMGIAMKAGKVKFGFDTVADSLRKKQAKLVILALDLSSRSLKKMQELAEINNIKVLDISISMDEIYRAIGKKTGIICVNDEGFAKKMINISMADKMRDNN